ncbi:uncharacterized protein [Centruroides vittatus]|uniref:uncharacterized protein n=1 Tax=Centruroides vittatus TaxID=120091 RepID=UPI00350ECF73
MAGIEQNPGPLSHSPPKRGRPPLTRSTSTVKMSKAACVDTMLRRQHTSSKEKEGTEITHENEREKEKESMLEIYGEVRERDDNPITTSIEQLSKLVQASHKSITEQILELKSEISLIHQELKEFKTKFGLLEQKVNQLEAMVPDLDRKMEAQQYMVNNTLNIIKQANLMLFGYPIEESTIIKESLVKFIQKTLKITDFKLEEIKDIYIIKKEKPTILKISLTNVQRKNQIISYFYNYKKVSLEEPYNNLRMSSDFTQETRDRRAKILPYYIEAKKKGVQILLRNDYIIYKNMKITYSFTNNCLVDAKTFLDVNFNY